MRWPATRRFLSIGQQAFTGFQCQEAFLVVGDVDEGILCAAASGSGRIQRRLVLVTTPIHLGHQLFVPLKSARVLPTQRCVSGWCEYPPAPLCTVRMFQSPWSSRCSPSRCCRQSCRGGMSQIRMSPFSLAPNSCHAPLLAGPQTGQSAPRRSPPTGHRLVPTAKQSSRTVRVFRPGASPILRPLQSTWTYHPYVERWLILPRLPLGCSDEAIAVLVPRTKPQCGCGGVSGVVLCAVGTARVLQGTKSFTGSE